jgi:hypothetical protein
VVISTCLYWLSLDYCKDFIPVPNMVGAARNLVETDIDISVGRKVIIYVGTLFSVQIVNAIEGFAVLYAFVRPVKTFDVVNKN